jgi:hypothetical protein
MSTKANQDFKEYDVVKLAIDLPMENLKKGAVGTILMIFDDGPEYEVEFCDNEGIPISKSTTVTLIPNQIEKFTP